MAYSFRYKFYEIMARTQRQVKECIRPSHAGLCLWLCGELTSIGTYSVEIKKAWANDYKVKKNDDANGISGYP